MSEPRNSAFDYTITLTRRYRYLMVSCPEFGTDLPADFLDVLEMNPQEIGAAVLRVIQRVGTRLHELAREGRRPPPPLGLRRVFSVKQAAQFLDVPPSEIRRLARAGLLDVHKTPGGHFRFTLESLSRFLVKDEIKPTVAQGIEARQAA